jgi:hypothetical protein
MAEGWKARAPSPPTAFSLSPSEGERVGERGPFAPFWWYHQDEPDFHAKRVKIPLPGCAFERI